MSMRVAGCCSFSILEFSGGLTAVSTESDVGGPCASNHPPASCTYRGLCVPLPSLVLLGATTLSGQLVNAFGVCFHAWYALAKSRFTWEWHRGCVLPLHYSHGWDHMGFARVAKGSHTEMVLAICGPAASPIKGACWSWTCRSFLLCAFQEASCFTGIAGKSSDFSLQHFIHLVYT